MISQRKQQETLEKGKYKAEITEKLNFCQHRNENRLRFQNKGFRVRVKSLDVFQEGVVNEVNKVIIRMRSFESYLRYKF